MTTSVVLRFPLGRYHATPWGRAVNEAAVEWPPSPWRVLRALYATWRWRAPDLPADVVGRLLVALAEAPAFRLPRYTEAHTRHYMPDPMHRSGKGQGTDKALDPFVAVDPAAEMILRWSGDLDVDTRGALGQLCSLLAYLGRAESVCGARVAGPDEVDGSSGTWVEPNGRGTLTAPTVRVLAPVVPLDLRALVATTTDVRKAGRVAPRGARWIAYPQVPPDRPPALRPARAKRNPTRPTAVRLALDPPVLPSRRDAVLYGHVLREAAIAQRRDPSPTLSGHSAGPRQDAHAHAHYVPLDSDEDTLLDTAVVWAPEGFSPQDVEALLGIRRLSPRVPGFRPVRVAVEAVGPVQDLAPELSGLKPAARWVSATPFAPYRHQKRETVQEFVQAEVDRELSTRRLPPARAELLPGNWLSFRRKRPGRAPELRALGLVLQFAEPLHGPILLGALSHFGLGMFWPER